MNRYRFSDIITKIVLTVAIFCTFVLPLGGVLIDISSPKGDNLKDIAPYLAGYNAKGTAEFIDNNGTMITAFHVGGDNKKMCVMVGGTCYKARLVSGNYNNDLAVIKIDYKSPYYMKISPVSSRIGMNIIKLGYPESLVKEGYPDIKRGNILQCGKACRIGPPDAFCVFTSMDITTWVSRPGDSGGAVLNYTGGIVGIVSAGNDFYSISASWSAIINLLNRSHISYETSTIWSKPYQLIVKDNSKATKVVWLQVSE